MPHFDDNADGEFDLQIVLRDGIVHSDLQVARRAFGFFRSVSDLFGDCGSGGRIDMTTAAYPPELTREALWYCLAFAHFAPEGAPPRPTGRSLRVTLDFLGGADLLCKAIDDHVSTPERIGADNHVSTPERIGAVRKLKSIAYLDRYIRKGALLEAIDNYAFSDLAEAMLACVYDEYLKYVDDKDGKTALIWACSINNAELAKAIMARVDNEHIKHADNNGNTALSETLWFANKDLAEAIMARVDDEHLKHVDEHNGSTLLMTVIETTYTKTKESEEEYNAVVDTIREIAEAIMARVDDEHIKHANKYGDTALSLAVENGFTQLAEAIRNHLNPPSKKCRLA